MDGKRASNSGQTKKIAKNGLFVVILAARKCWNNSAMLELKLPSKSVTLKCRNMFRVGDDLPLEAVTK